MSRKLSQYQLTGIKKLIPFKKHFKKEKNFSVASSGKKSRDKEHINHPQKFIETFCGYNLADTDYADLQKDFFSHESSNVYISQASLDVILKYLTYIIWTDKFVGGYFITKVNDHTVYHLIDRLEAHLQQWGIFAEY